MTSTNLSVKSSEKQVKIKVNSSCDVSVKSIKCFMEKQIWKSGRCVSLLINNSLGLRSVAGFKEAVEASLTVDAEVTNVVATDVARRRLLRRQLLQAKVDVAYTLQVPIAADSTAFDTFTALVDDLTAVVAATDSPLVAALAQMAPTITVNQAAFVAPTTYAYAEVKVSTSAPTVSHSYPMPRLPRETKRTEVSF